MVGVEEASVTFIEIRARDGRRAASFYGRVFDWHLTRPVGQPSISVDTGRAPGGALLELPAPIPLALCPYLRVTDCVATARLAGAQGAHTLLEGQDAGAAGSFSLLIDPWGNHLACWQERQPPPPPQGSGRHPFCWLELAVAELDAAIEFYGALFGWRFKLLPGGAYATTQVGPIGIGLLAVGLDSTRGPLCYVQVSSLDAALDRARAAGGACRVTPRSFVFPAALGSDGAHFAVLSDPDDNALGLLAAT